MIAIPHSISPQDYLDLDRQNPIRHEYRISQDTQRVEIRRRLADNTWETTIYQTGDPILLPSLNLELAIARLYRGLD
ncbi:hypothetical protein E1H12_01605 [Geitlerinema sp. P-1104]|uniref:hypothetical protein n=1 Tax=Geitlerinema sp. P-1104 TaxID=2546230 RepID=UPI001477595C|nr:hypothetical protein [Geitlerinema sp. P-1104]NMG57244.1 hypothetical protein [Geitlerinema sp. P-1104]